MPIAGVIPSLTPLSATLADMVAKVESALYSYYSVRDRVGSLTQPVGANDFQVYLDNVPDFGRGFIEITSDTGIEEIAISSKVLSDGYLIVPPWGRGQRGTLAQGHPVGARVVMDPTFPRRMIVDAINDTILGIYPDIFAVGVDDTQQVDLSKTDYTVPASAESVIAVEYQQRITGDYKRVQRWRYMPDLKRVGVYSPMDPQQPVRVTFRQPPSPLFSLGDQFTSSGLANSAQDVVILGAVFKMLSGRISGSTSDQIPESAVAAQVFKPDAAINASRQVYAQYTFRLQAESSRLRRLYPPTPHLTQ